MRRNAVVAAGFNVPTKMVQQLPQSGHGYLCLQPCVCNVSQIYAA